MPQCMSGNWKAKDIPYGKGSRHGDLLESTFRTRRRADKINEGERGRCHLITYMLDKHQKAVEDRTQKVMNRIRNSIEQREAYQQVLQSYRAEKFRTLQWGFKKRQIRSPKSFQRYKLETRVYNCGFSEDTLSPEVDQIAEVHRNRQKAFHERLVEDARKRSDYLIDRRLTDEGIRRERQRTLAELRPLPISAARLRKDINLRMHTSI